MILFSVSKINIKQIRLQISFVQILKYSFSGLCTILFMRAITLHTIHVGALENYTKSKNITKVVNRTLIGNRGHGKNNIYFNYYFC